MQESNDHRKSMMFQGKFGVALVPCKGITKIRAESGPLLNSQKRLVARRGSERRFVSLQRSRDGTNLQDTQKDQASHPPPARQDAPFRGQGRKF